MRDFDLIGVSCDPQWSSIDLTRAAAALARARFGRLCVIAEVSYPFSLQDAGDKAGNLLGEDARHRGYPATLHDLKRFMNDVVAMTPGAGVVGRVSRTAWVYTRCATRWGIGSHWENATLFDFWKGNERTPAADFPKAVRVIH